MPSQSSAYNYTNYGSPYGAQVARATQSPTELQSPMGGPPRYPVHPSPAEIPASQTPSLGLPKNRKRKSMGDKGGESQDDEGSPGEMTPGGSAADRASKRTKTQRACDPCRRKKIRCDILAESEPPQCQHCKQYGFDCTFFLPITETRFKKKKELEEAAKVKQLTESHQEDDDPASVTKESQIKGDVKIYGPTSLHYLVHATNNVPRQAFDRYDTRWNVSLKIGPKGDGFIHVNDPEPNPSDEEGVKRESEAIRELDRGTMEELINRFFLEVYPYFPILTKEEFIDQVETIPDERFVLYAVALASASRRGVSEDQFESLRSTLNHIMRGQDTLSVSNVPNVQGLMIMQLCFDTHATYMTQPATANYLRTGAAIRMAQDMGMHRAESGAIKHYLNRRRRVWACALVVDRWMAAAMGHPYMIDRLDCDVRLPTEEPYEEGGKERPLAYLGQMVQLSLILGDVLKTIYGPTGIDKATDEELNSIVKRLDDWKDNCPPDFQFSVDTKSVHSGILHMMHTCISIIFWRVFMRITYRCPVHIKFSLTVERWTSLVRASKDAVAWFCRNPHTYDLWWVVSYNLISISLCLFQTWTRRMDVQAAESLRNLRDATQGCENALGTEQQKSRRKTSELISLLYEATQGAAEKGEKAILNPTAGVALREQPTPMVFKRDSSRPGGGVYVLDKAADLQKHKDLPPGTFLVEERAPARPADDNTSPSSQQSGHAGPSITMNPASYAGDTAAQLDFIGAYMNPMPNMNMVSQQTAVNIVTGMENLNPILAMSDESAQQVTLINTLGQDLSEFGNVAIGDASLFSGLPGNMANWAEDWGVYFSSGNRQFQDGYHFGPDLSSTSQAGQNTMNMQQPPTQ
ncbi:hypothetical protein DACRYDRAFT_20007 [Dacryopinax primogenitus]|uniref:Zn(2)-C6 fungal-type domain-containing protein n=1 Tax=Dacryopinax primogenitus (strain DJM 731) TaxID=1858805 RepID=M5GAZ7_DACPD|nr:uncharacterized protein DACRYDRAFT_20007 [Dacryopinax primogenitus]EJU05565.1 hypothetical protein DACRYDRAFT_20007 [Dacryopinax primogenitus]